MRLTLIVLAGLLLPAVVDASVAELLPARGPDCVSQCDAMADRAHNQNFRQREECISLARFRKDRIAECWELFGEAHRMIEQGRALCLAHCAGSVGCNPEGMPAARTVTDPIRVPGGSPTPYVWPVPVPALREGE